MPDDECQSVKLTGIFFVFSPHQPMPTAVTGLVSKRAYDNPKFVEDLVRDVALALNQQPQVSDYMVEAENFESIHNHSAFARIVRTIPAPD